MCHCWRAGMAFLRWVIRFTVHIRLTCEMHGMHDAIVFVIRGMTGNSVEDVRVQLMVVKRSQTSSDGN